MDGDEMSKLKIRKAIKNDSKDILFFINQLAKFEKLEDQVMANIEYLEKYIFDKEYAEVVILEVDHKKIGFALYFYTFSTFESKPSLYLEDLFVLPEERQKGYGKETLIYLANKAIEKECARFEWSCLKWNKNAIDFYTKFGALPQNEWTLFRLEGSNLLKYKKKL
jgi:GNAT superfamily N-acetyltransferase